MDWSDELNHESGESCSFTPNALECDEHVCPRNSYACGDGQCVEWITRMAFQRFVPAKNDCFNKRNLNYMCEVSPHRRSWTLESGLCSPDEDYDDPQYLPWNMINASNLTNDEKCQYLLRCILSDGFEHDCPCNRLNCTQLMIDICSGNYMYQYPPQGLINPNVFFFYSALTSIENPSINVALLGGNLKCRGYHFTATTTIGLHFRLEMLSDARINRLLCSSNDSNYGNKDFLSPLQYDKFCWNETLTFNGRPYAVNPDTCTTAGECISQYRIHDGFVDCFGGDDENKIFDKDYCTKNVGRHRFQCFNDQHKCLPLIYLGSGTSECLNSYDEIWYDLGLPLRQNIKCQKSDTLDCDRLKEYIDKSSVKTVSSLVHSEQRALTSQIPFRSYCDSFWDTHQHDDELPSSCQYWVCQSHQYRCRTGQCIDLDWVCDGEWDCSDASDEEAVVLLENWSIHNAHLVGLNSRIEKCRERYSKSPFSGICNTSFELGCYLSRVSNPLDIVRNHPCINLTQIGDGVEDCYNSYDEKNTFTVKDIGSMWGFHLRCGDDYKSYPYACSSETRNNCTKILCSNHRDENGTCSDVNDVICLDGSSCEKNARCNGVQDCQFGEDEYWCPSGSVTNQVQYRFDKKASYKPNVIMRIPQYPPQNMPAIRQKQLSKFIVNPRNDPLFTKHSYQCNRGVAILQDDIIICLCPPAYYGNQCEFFSDRISVIAHLDQKTSLTKTLKIKANFLFYDTIIDAHEFIINPTIESWTTIKHRFYLIYSRSAQMLTHKRQRYFNRTDVISNHPYSVHFDVFALENNNNVTELGSWHYPIYFDYLPAYRLAVVLKFPAWFLNKSVDPCAQNMCNETSICMPIFNQKNSYYCSCKSGYYGKDCHMYNSHSETYCSANALSQSNANDLQPNSTKSYCICPQNRFGSRCNLKYDGCDSNPCLNYGTCFLTDDRSGEAPYRCVCSKRFYGNRCQFEKASVHVDLNMRNASSVHVTVVQLYDIEVSSLQLLLHHQQLYHSLPSSISYDNDNSVAPALGLLKIYQGLEHPQYFIMYILIQTWKVNITSSPQYCPHVSSLLSEGTDINQSVPAVFWYHHICRNNTQRFCFHDENYLCICELDHYRAECFRHDTQLDHCQYCLSGGKCLRGDLNDPSDFTCLCPPSHHGRRCEFSLESFNATTPQSFSTATISTSTSGSKRIKIDCVSITTLLFSIYGFLNHFSLFGHI
jgi:hypothetical protein